MKKKRFIRTRFLLLALFSWLFVGHASAQLTYVIDGIHTSVYIGNSYNCTLPDGSILQFRLRDDSDGYYWSLKAITTTSHSMMIPDSVQINYAAYARDENGNYIRDDRGYYIYDTTSYVYPVARLEVTAISQTVDTLFVPATVLAISSLPCVQCLHMMGDKPYCYNYICADYVYVPAAFYSNYFSSDFWTNNAIVLVEGSQLRSLVINMANEGELARIILDSTNQQFGSVGSLTITGPLSSVDFNNFRYLTNLITLDLSGANISDIPDNFSNGGFHHLNTLLLPSLNSIGNNAFSGCGKLDSVSMPSVTSIGNGAFSNCILSRTTLPEGLQAIGNRAFYNCGISEVTLPESLRSIGDEAFYQCNLTSIHLPNNCQYGPYAFAGNLQLANVTLPSSQTYVPEGAFQSDTALRYIEIPNGVTSIGYAAFQRSGLDSINLPDGLTTIVSEAFSYCLNLKNIDLPNGLTRIGSRAFYCCYYLHNVSMPTSLTTIDGAAFVYCLLTKIDIPASVRTIDMTAFSGNLIDTIVCNAVTPPSVVRSRYDQSVLYNGTIVPDRDLLSVKLYVPSIVINNYRTAPSWSEFFYIYPMTERLSTLDVYNHITIADGNAIDTNAVVRMHSEPYGYYYDDYYGYYCDHGYTSSLTYQAPSPLEMSLLTMEPNTSIIALGAMSADSAVTFITNDEDWKFISLPYDVRVRDIVYPEGAQFAIRTYSGLNRAQQSGSTWVNLTIDSIMHAHQGYIFKSNANYGTSFAFPAIQNANNHLFETTDATIPLHHYISTYSHNASWNFVGNPYPCYYDTREMNFTAPITVWNGNSYDAYSPVDDSYILKPNEAFFVQSPTGVNGMTFDAEGRQVNDSVQNNYKSNVENIADRKVINIAISDSILRDRTRIVLNSNASIEYELGRDAEKIMIGISNPMQIYTIADEILYAINERPLDEEEISLGYRAAIEGTYTLAATHDEDVILTLIDHDLNNEVVLNDTTYSFFAEQGSNDGRFSIKLQIKNGSVGIDTAEQTQHVNLLVNGNMLNVDADYEVYSILGRHVGSNKANTAIRLPMGVYIVIANNVSHKIVILK